METPSSTRRITRSQAIAAANSANKIPTSKKIEETVGKSRQRTGKQSALIDITNDSPIVGLAMGKLETPSSEMSKKRTTNGFQGKQEKCNTPGSGEALLRGQVKTLLQKVEEEAVLSKISLENRPFLHLKGIVNNSPMGLLAPTPANTPLMDFSVNDLPSVTASPVEDKFVISQIINQMFEGEKKESLETEKSYITRSLLLDFYEKSEGSESSKCSSVVTEKTVSDDDNSSIWSIQVNASSTKDIEEEDEEEEDGFVEEEYDDEEEEEDYDENEEDGDLVDELCDAISNINVNEGPKMMAKFEGKHSRFVYNSDGELEGVEEDENAVTSPSVLHLKGLPTPQGKHLRFTEEIEEN